jgi:UDP-N-acetylmuramyl tripeptide synthase
MRTRSTVAVGKTIQHLMRLRGGGSALPGLVAEKIDPDFMRRTLAQIRHGVVLISGTNGKTTTTKMVVELLESQGLRVFTNRTGSNFTRGVTAALLGEVDAKGKIDADIAVLELDEAHAVHFVRRVKPTYSLFLNVLRDQLDRFGEIDYTADLLKQIAQATTKGIVINRDDPRLGSPSFVENVQSEQIRTYGVSSALLKLFPSDEQMRDADAIVSTHTPTMLNDTSLEAIDEQMATIQYDGTSHDVNLQVKGIYNLQNAVGAIALVRLILGDKLNQPAMLRALASVQPAFGRGETIDVDGHPLELVLVKNPSGFRLSLSSFAPEQTATMIAINDNYADGRDMSWLWDVDFESLKTSGVDVISGIRAYDMALRLQYDEVETRLVDINPTTALRGFISHNPDTPKRIFCTYTAMLSLRRELAKIAKVSVVS